MPRENRVKRARQIAGAVRIAPIESTAKPSTQPPPAEIEVTRAGGSGSTPDSAYQSLPIQPLTTQPPPIQAQPSQPPSPHMVGSSVASALASDVPSRVRGVTQGKNAAKLRRQLGPNIPVPILSSNHKPKGEHAPSLANHLGLAIREVSPVRPHGWKKLDTWIKLAVIAAVKSKKAQESRAQLPYNHTSGSRSFASRMSLMVAQNAGQAPPITQFFCDTHYRRKSNEWVNEVAQQRHEALVQQTEEQLQPSVTTPMSEEQIDVDVLGKRSGYVKGYEIHSRTSSSSTQSRAPDPEVIALREQLAKKSRRQAEQLAEQGRRQAEQLAEQDRRACQLEALVQRLAAVLGIDPTTFLDTAGGTSSAGDGTAPGGS